MRVPQFSHYVIFFIAIFTVLQLVVLGASTYPIKRRWDSAAYKSKDEVRKTAQTRQAAERPVAETPVFSEHVWCDEKWWC